MRSSRRSKVADSHTCPLGLRCSCLPIKLDDRLVGVAKLVVGPETSDAALSAATDVLKVFLSEACEGSLVAVLSEEVGALRHRVEELQRLRSNGGSHDGRSGRPGRARRPRRTVLENRSLVERALSCLRQHYQEPDLSLVIVAERVGCNPMYLTNRFTQIVGEHMHHHLVGLRVAHACRLLLGTDLMIKQVACESGFPGSAQLARAFRKHVGVSPSEYRRVFLAP